ncbi:hypothetical protein, partial [Escherichia coli]|uniref:hypothetical protein n=1 Tax=Escherichia coli TaxID=562 RepID=UPI0015970466
SRSHSKVRQIAQAAKQHRHERRCSQLLVNRPAQVDTKLIQQNGGVTAVFVLIAKPFKGPSNSASGKTASP